MRINNEIFEINADSLEEVVEWNEGFEKELLSARIDEYVFSERNCN